MYGLFLVMGQGSYIQIKFPPKGFDVARNLEVTKKFKILVPKLAVFVYVQAGCISQVGGNLVEAYRVSIGFPKILSAENFFRRPKFFSGQQNVVLIFCVVKLLTYII